MINSNCVLFYLFQFTVICAASIVIIILVSTLLSSLLSSINCHCNQFLQHQPFVVIHLRPELPEYYFGSYSKQLVPHRSRGRSSKQLVPHRSRGRSSKQLGHIEVAEECHIEVVVEEVTKCDTSHHVSILRQCQCMICDLQLIQ